MRLLQMAGTPVSAIVRTNMHMISPSTVHRVDSGYAQ
jgi:hypothetical protein